MVSFVNLIMLSRAMWLFIHRFLFSRTCKADSHQFNFKKQIRLIAPKLELSIGLGSSFSREEISFQSEFKTVVLTCKI